MKTLLERAKRCPLDVTVNRGVPVSTMMLLSSHTKQIRSLNVSGLENVQKFSEFDSEPPLLLQALTIDISGWDSSRVVSTTHPPPFLNNAVNLKVLRVHSESWRSLSLACFVFPNLILFDLSLTPSEDLSASQLLHFLEASPMLQTVYIETTAFILPGDIPEGRIVILPNVKEFNLIMDGNHGYWLATFMSCPSASRTTFTQNRHTRDMLPGGFFPDFDQWNAIARQYTRGPAEEVVLESTATSIVTCTITFRSPDDTVIKLCFRDTAAVNYNEGADVQAYAFYRAVQKIRDHPRADIKRLRISHGSKPGELPEIANGIAELFQSLGPLDELTIFSCNILPFFPSFFDIQDYYVREPVVFPRIKELTIRHPASSDEVCTTAIVGLAKSHHALGIPLERVIFCATSMPPGMEEAVRPWVGSVENFYEE